MKEKERQSSTPPSKPDPHQSQGPLDEAGALFQQMMSEATRRSNLERGRVQSRGAVVRLLLVLTIMTCLLAAATGIYGVYNFPDAPIRQTESGYAGKGGKAHTKEEFERFILWKQVMFIAFPVSFAFGLAFGVTDMMQRRKHRS
jgi:hypothetical protein